MLHGKYLNRSFPSWERTALLETNIVEVPAKSYIFAGASAGIVPLDVLRQMKKGTGALRRGYRT